MADNWEKRHRKLIDKIKAGGYEAAIEHHTKGMLAAESALQAAYELGMEGAGDNMTGHSAKIAGKCREMLFNLKHHHCQADNAASDLMNMPVARDGSR